MAYTSSIGAFICYLHVSLSHDMKLFNLTDIIQTRLVQGQNTARHNIDVARIQLFIRTHEYEEARTKLERNLAT